MFVTDEQRFRGVFERAIEGIFQTTPDGRYIAANPALARIYGYSSPEDLREGLYDIGAQLYVKAGRRAEFLRLMAEWGKVSNFESQVYRKDGSIIWISENAVAVRDELGRLLYYEGFVTDVTGRHASEEALRATREELENSLAELRATQQQVVQTERLRALGAMVTGIAHDFNNALTLILGYGEILQYECRREPVSPQFAEYAQTIVSAALDAAEIVSRLQEFHRPAEPGETQTVLSLNAVIEQTVAFTRPRWESESRARGVPVEIDLKLGQIEPLAGNAAELREMLTNLIFNAVDAMPQGGTIGIATRMRGARIELAVSDTGLGMTEEVRRRCLEPFFTTKGDRGSGLGLAMVYGIVERHGGDVVIDSALGRGCRFIFTFEPDHSGVDSVADEQAPQVRPLRVLVVDDHPVQRELLSHALARDWHTVITASDGRDALRKYESEHFDLVITDKAMPEMNGDQLAVAIKSRDPETRVVMLTGFASRDAEEEMSEFIDLMLPKPVTVTELRSAIAKVMGSIAEVG